MFPKGKVFQIAFRRVGGRPGGMGNFAWGDFLLVGVNPPTRVYFNHWNLLQS